VSDGQRPNILVIWGDDIGSSNLSCYNLGLMGYQTPNIDRLAREGALCTDAYGEQSCTAGRAAFILGQHPVRTGLLTIGTPRRRRDSPQGDEGRLTPVRPQLLPPLPAGRPHGPAGRPRNLPPGIPLHRPGQ